MGSELSLRRLQYFLAVVDSGTVTAAAQQLFVAQPALSRQIKVLEHELNLSLFSVHGNRLVLTPGGAALVPLARKLVVQAQRFRNSAADLASGRVNSLTIGATELTVRTVLAPFIATSGPEDPIMVTRTIAHRALYESLDQGIDLVLTPTHPQAGFNRLLVVEAPVRMYVRSGSELASQLDRRPVRLRDIAALPLVLHSTAAVSRSLLDIEAVRHGIALDRVLDCDDGSTLLALASAGKAIALTTALADPSLDLVQSTLHNDAGQPIQLPLHAAWQKNHFAAPLLETLARRIRDFARHYLDDALLGVDSTNRHGVPDAPEMAVHDAAVTTAASPPGRPTSE